MTGVDYVILGIVLISALVGLMRGFLREVCSLLTWILAFWLAWHFGARLEPHLGGALADPPFSIWAGRAIIFIAVLLLGALIGALLSQLVRLSLFSGTDRFLGFVLGLLRGTVVLGLAAILCQAARLDGESWWKHSRLVPYVQGVASVLHALAGDRHARGSSSVDL